MFQILKWLSYSFYICLLILFFIGENSSSEEEDFSLGPLFDSDQDKTQQTQEVDALGPFITSKKTETRFEYGFHPLFYLVEGTGNDSTEFNFFSTFFFTKQFKQGVDLWRMNSTFFRLFSVKMQKMKMIATLLYFLFMEI